jgi:hypothetical protein
LISSIVALAIIVASFFATRPPETEVKGDLIVKDAVQEGVHQDLDGDGLESWEEELWGTNENNKDTDGDGTMDGEEVKVGRDPKKKGPKDRKEDTPVATTTRYYYYDDDPSLTTTDIIGRDLLSGQVALEQGGKLTQANINTLIDSTIQKARSRMEPIPTQYTPEDVRVGRTNDIEIAHAYYNGIATIILENSTSTISEKDMTAIWTSKNLAERRTLAEKEAARQKTFADRLLLLTVPAELAKDHLVLINSTAEGVVILGQVAKIKTANPIDDLLLLQEFRIRMEDTGASLKSLFSSPLLTRIPWDPNKNEPMAKLAELKLAP